VEGAGRPLAEPAPPLYAVARVHHLDGHGLEPVADDPVHHEDEGRYLQAGDAPLQVEAGVPPAGPEPLLVGDHLRRHAEVPGEELVVEADRLVLPVDLGPAPVVEGVVAPHLEDGEVAARRVPDEVDVLEPDAGLADDEGVGRRREDPLRHVGLEVDDAGDGHHQVVPPAGDDGIGADPLVAPLLEEGEESLPHPGDVEAPVDGGIADERVVDARCVAAALGVGDLGPVVAAAGRAEPPDEAVLLEEGEPELVRRDLQLRQTPDGLRGTWERPGYTTRTMR